MKSSIRNLIERLEEMGDCFWVWDANVVEEIYYNPDASSGGQIVYNKIPYEEILSFEENIKTSEFFDNISMYSRQILIDIDDPEFSIYAKDALGRSGGAWQGCNDAVRNAIYRASLNTVLSKKVNNEYLQYIEKIRAKSTDEIIRFSGETVLKTVMTRILSSDSFSNDEMKKMLQLERTLDSCYDVCLKTKNNHIDEITKNLQAFVSSLPEQECGVVEDMEL